MKIKTYLLLSTSLAAAAFVAGPALAQSVWTGESSYYYTGDGTGGCAIGVTCSVNGNPNWNTGQNWDGSVPDLSTDVFIGQATSGARPVHHDTVTITDTITGTDASARSISIGYAGNRSSEGATGAGALRVEGDLVVDQNINVGVTGTGTYDNLDTTTITSGNLVVGSQFATGTANNHAGGNITLESGSVVVANGVFDNDGTLQIESGSLIIGEDGASRFLGDLNSTLGSIGRDLVVGKSADGEMISDTDITVRNNTTIGGESGVLGQLTLREGADLTTDGALTVGDHGDATFTIGRSGDAASTVTTGDKVVIGNESGSEGRVDVDNGSMVNDWTLTVGNEGAGALNVAEGSSVTTERVVKLGVESGSLGIIINSGTVENDRGLIIGDEGTGAFFTEGQNASTRTVGDVTLGQERGGLGLVVVDDGGEMASNGRFDVGHEGQGYLLVTDGGSVSNGAGTIARREGSSGFAVVTDAGSVWENEFLTVGEANDTLGVLVINDGGTVRIGDGEGTLVIAAQEGSEGILNIGAFSHDPDTGYGFDPYVEDLIDGENYNGDARAAGFLDAQFVEFGEGNGTVNFKTTSTWFDDYHFQAGFVGEGTVNHLAGFTVLDGDSSDFTGTVNIVDGTLVANNVLAGDVNVGSDGVLSIGHGGTTGDVVNDIANAGRVFFNRSDAYEFDSVISGTGDVAQIGSGTTIITADQAYEGQTRIWNGTLQLGNGGTVGSIDDTSGVHIGRWGTLAFNRSDVVLFDREITGRGTINQIGSGFTVLTVDSDNFNGHANVRNGVLALADVNFGGSVDIEDGAALIGYGSVDDTTVENGGVISPGAFANLGELTITDDFHQEEGSTYFAKLHTDGLSDHLAILDDARIDEGAQLRVATVGGGRHELEHRYTVLTAQDELEGQYELVGDLDVSTFYRLTDNYDYDAGQVYVDVAQHRLFNEAALTANQTAAAGAAQELKAERSDEGTPTNELFRAIAYLPTDELAQFAFDQISGEIYASTTVGLIEQSRFVRDATGQRIRDAFGGVGAANNVDDSEGLSIWADGFGSWSTIDSDGNAGTFSHNTGGIFIGADVPLTDIFRIGVLGGYSHSSFGAEGRGSSASSDNYDLGIYGGGQIDNFGFRLGANHTWHSISTDRNVNFPGFSDSLSADYNARTTQVYGDIGYTIDLGGVSFEPFAGLAYVNVDRDGYGESGGVAALSGSSDVVDATFATLGLRGSALLSAGEMPITATGMVGWRHAFEEITPTATHSFAGGSPFTVAGIPLAQDVAVIEAGLEAQLSTDLTLGVSYSGQFGSGISDHGLRGNLNWKF